MKDIKGSIAVVTGGGQGLGKAISTTLAEAGVTVVVADVKEDTAAQTAQEIKDKGGSADYRTLDIGNEIQIQEALRAITKDHGRLDFVINNAGVDVTKAVDELSIEEIDRVIRINLRGTYLMSKFALEIMYKQKSGHVVNIASTAAKRAWANASAYHASKWGVIGMSQGLYVEARQHNVKVSYVIPGGMRTPFILERFPETPLDKLQDPVNVANAVKYVLSQPDDVIVPEMMVLPLQESSWP